MNHCVWAFFDLDTLRTMMIIRRRIPCGRPIAPWSKNVRSKTEKGRRGHVVMKHHSDNDHRQGLNHKSSPSMGTMSIERKILLHRDFGPSSFTTISDDGDRQHQRAATTSNSSFSKLSRLDDEEDERPFARNRNEWAVPYLDFFAESILQNVREVVGNWGGDDSKSLDSRTRGRILLKRWNVAYDKEREIYHRQIAWSKMKSTRPQKNTVVELWDDALQSIGISSSILNATEAMNNPLLPSHETLSHAGGEQDDTIMCDTTPLFGLAVDENFYIRDLETILLSDQDSVEQNLSSGDLPISDSHDIRERQLHLQSDSVNSVNNGDKYSIYQDAILRAVALLSATKPNDWIKFDSSHSPIESADDDYEADETHSRMDSPAGEGHLSDIDLDETVNAGKHELGFGDASSMLRGFLQEALDRRHAATTFEANLCLAYLTTSTSLEADTILERCLQIFNEMVMVADSGQHECQPDSFTYRLLLLSFNRRLMAQGEAIKLCQRLIKEETSSILTPEAFMEAIKTCQAKMDLSTANMMMELALTKRIQQPSVGACMVFVDMMKAQQRRDDSLAFFARVQHAHILSKEDEEKLLLSLCRWPNRTRRSHYIDLASFLLNILSTVEQKVASGEKLGLPLWTTLLEGLYKVAKVDHSQMQNIAGALRILLDADPHRSPGRKLTWIGLEVAEALGDSKLAAAILRQAAETRRLPTSIGTSSSRNRHITNFNESPDLPHQAMKIGLDICLKQGDAESAEAISEILEQLRDTIPTATQKELFSTILLCHTRVGDADKAKLYLQTLIAKGMSPG